MKYVIDSGPHIKDDDSTALVMNRLLIALIPIILFSIYKNSFLVLVEGKYSIMQALYPIFILLIASSTSILSEKIFVHILNKKYGYKKYKSYFALFPGLFLALIIPINTPLIIVFLGALIASIIGKMLFGGFGYNVFNPALIGALFILTAYGTLIASNGGYLNPVEIDTIATSTPLSNLSALNYVGTYEKVVNAYGSINSFIFGTIPGTLGEVSKILIVLAFVYLVLFKVIKWRIPVTYILTVFIMTFIIGYNNNLGIWYPIFHILSGGLLFGAVFMATDPVTSPVTDSGQIIYGISLGVLTVITRFLTSYPEGVLTSILTMNMLVFLIDRLGVKVKFNIKKIILPLTLMILLSFGLSLYISNTIKDTGKKNDRVQIINKEQSGSKTIYTLTTKGWGLIEAKVELQKGKVTKIEILNSSTETQWSEIEDNDYINTLINKQSDIENVDTISGTTRTSKALKDMIIAVLEDYGD